MKSLYSAEAVEEIKHRLDSLSPSSKRLWGKMEVAQMVAHCSTMLENALDEKAVPRMFIGRLLGPLVKSQFTNDKPFSKGGPTSPNMVVKDHRDFANERTRLMILISRFHEAGPSRCTSEPHFFFGNLTSEEWGKGMYKHVDHHFKQFNA